MNSPARRRRVPVIPPVRTEAERPFWSVMLPTHDDADLLTQALASVLAQDPGLAEMEIEVVDDGSTRADTEAVVRAVAGDRVRFYSHPGNRGAPATFTTCATRASGRWVHILHADDQVLPGFYGAYRQRIEATECGMVVGRSHFVDDAGTRTGLSGPLLAEDGRLVDAARVLALDHPVNFAAVVVSRDAYTAVGGFDPDLPHANDWEMWTRLAHHGPVGCVEQPLALYRQHVGSDTNRHRRSMTYVADPLRALDVIAPRFDDAGFRSDLRAHVRRHLASEALRVAEQQVEGGHRLLGLRSAAWAARHSAEHRRPAWAMARKVLASS